MGKKRRSRNVLRLTLVAALAIVPAAAAGNLMYTGSISGAGLELSTNPPTGGTNAGRLTTNGVASACGVAKAFPGVDNGNLFRKYRKHSFKNTSASSQCVTVTLDATGCPGQISSAAYRPAIKSSDLQVNYLGDLGSAPAGAASYGVDVPAGSSFDVVVWELTQNTGCTSYTLNLAFAGTSVQEDPLTSVSGAIAPGDSLQTGRVFRDGNQSACGAVKPNPGLTATGTLFRYDMYTFQNQSGVPQCVTASIGDLAGDCTTTSDSTMFVAYNTSFAPATPATNYAGDAGFSTIGRLSFSFDVAAGATFVIVVSETDVTSTCSGYTVRVTGFLPPTAVGVATVRAARTAGGASVTWGAASEVGVLGYRVYRESAGKRVPVGGLVAAARGAGYHLYTRVDRGAPRGSSRYWVQEVRLDGSHRWHGPATLAR